jgi:hypothetical protein
LRQSRTLHTLTSGPISGVHFNVKRAVKGVIDGGGRVASVDVWPDGRISVTVKEDKHRSMDPEDDPEVSRRLL